MPCQFVRFSQLDWLPQELASHSPSQQRPKLRPHRRLRGRPALHRPIIGRIPQGASTWSENRPSLHPLAAIPLAPGPPRRPHPNRIRRRVPPPSPRQPLVSPQKQPHREQPPHRRPRKARCRRRTHSCLPPTKQRRPSSTTGAHTTATRAATGSYSKTGIAVVRGWPRSCRRPVWWSPSRHPV